MKIDGSSGLRLATVLASVFMIAVASQASAGLISLSIQAEKSVVKASSEIRLDLSIRNESDQVVKIGMTNPVFDYHITVSRADGKFVPETEFMRRAKNRVGNISRARTATLYPHQTTHDTIAVGELYDMSEPGEYLIQLERELPEQLGHGTVRSNTIKVTLAS
jgi:hypothetical protein